ncbi:hypothetical protein HNP46_006066 [Pseudomonas nitritireducens]|uniref:Uncharacterized protein n=1 Tax=Pseudomonas nitroreducens TaxID=46680 RepID=A0A7W7P4Y5_PSENT|nr:hypothetical protein [Pseudomonas nitritireducens]MBB4867155.1 hypothetical protein [Pseudomonas nitritireducens]
MRHTKSRAWENLRLNLQDVTLTGRVLRDHTDCEELLHDALDELQALDLPVKAIAALETAIFSAYRIGKERYEKD